MQSDARRLAAFLPHCATLLARLMRDPRVRTRDKVLVGALVAYLSIPIDIIPDFIPVLGHLDDAALAAWVLRRILRSGGEPLIREHWPGPDQTLAVVLRVAA